MLLSILEYLGIFVFAISGLLTAADKNVDYFGGVVIAFFTALGGGTVRDILLNTDVRWMQSEWIVFAAVGGAITGILFRKHLSYFRRTFFLFDTLGLGLFTIVGIQRAIDHDQIPITCLLLGMVTATFGGVIRDILCNEIPLIFRKEIYATAALFGGLVYLGLERLPYLHEFSMLIAVAVIVLVRVMSVVFKWQMPKFGKE